MYWYVYKLILSFTSNKMVTLGNDTPWKVCTLEPLSFNAALISIPFFDTIKLKSPIDGVDWYKTCPDIR